jgi:hypothetical protein
MELDLGDQNFGGDANRGAFRKMDALGCRQQRDLALKLKSSFGAPPGGIFFRTRPPAGLGTAIRQFRDLDYRKCSALRDN